MEAKMFSDGAMLKMGWAKAKEYLWINIGIMIVAMLAVYLPMIVLGGIGEAIDMPGLFILLGSLATIAISAVVGAGMIRVYLNIVDGKAPTVAMLFSEKGKAVNYILATILYSLVVMIGFFLFIIPGIIWSLKYMFVPMLVVDKNMKPMDALKESARLTDGMKWDLFAFYHVVGIVMMLGYMALGVGVLVTVPAGMIAYMGVYRIFAPAGASAAPAADATPAM
jgi:uncharacterized membrane protein